MMTLTEAIERYKYMSMCETGELAEEHRQISEWLMELQDIKTHGKHTETHGVCSDIISRQDAIDAIMGEPTDAHYPSWYADKIKALPSAEPKTGEWVSVSDIRKLQDILLMKIDSFEGTRNIVEKGMLETWKEVAEYISEMLGKGGEDE